jgi:hypothetical protein
MAAEEKRWHTREDSGLRLDRELRWWHDDQPIEHPKIIEAFNTGLIPTEDGRYKLVFGNDWALVQVEECAYGVVALDLTDDGALSVRLTDRTAERLACASLVATGEGVLTCAVKGGRARARFTRDAQFQLGSLIEQENGAWGLRVGARWFLLPPGLGLDS